MTVTNTTNFRSPQQQEYIEPTGFKKYASKLNQIVTSISQRGAKIHHLDLQKFSKILKAIEIEPKFIKTEKFANLKRIEKLTQKVNNINKQENRYGKIVLLGVVIAAVTTAAAVAFFAPAIIVPLAVAASVKASEVILFKVLFGVTLAVAALPPVALNACIVGTILEVVANTKMEDPDHKRKTYNAEIKTLASKVLEDRYEAA